ncbi:MAG: plasmid stability protein [Proteobacteria bacterium]|nr:plasmid stability protein [Pseudomonadota bacterium]
MSAITIRNLPEATHRALKMRAARHGHSTEAEIREILKTTVAPPERIKLGSLLAAIGRRAGSVKLDIKRDKSATKPIQFE